jgi:hypothetical protein
MKRLIMLLLLLGLCVPGIAFAQGGEQPLVIPAGQHVAGSVATLSQAIVVEGAVDGDVTSWSGAITIAGNVGGDVVSYAGLVTIVPTGKVAGHVLASGGELRVASGAAVAGQAIRGAGGGDALASLLDLFTPVSGSGDSPIGRVLFGAVLGVLLVAFCLLYIAFWPRRMQIASATLQQLAPRALSLGLLTSMTLSLMLPPLAAMLIASVVGVPVLLVVLALTLAVYIYGLAVLAHWAGQRLSVAVDRTQSLAHPTIVIAVVLALALASITVVQPLYGVALFFLLASPGLGAAILSRGGMALPLGVASLL